MKKKIHIPLQNFDHYFTSKKYSIFFEVPKKFAKQIYRETVN